MSALELDDALATIASCMAAGNMLVVTGAGISTASGIPDYRDRDGVRRGRPPMMYQEFATSQASRKRYWARSTVGWPRVRDAGPNEAHTALAEVGQTGLLGGLITQNVDGLHQKAGSVDVVDLHGNLHRVRCMDCQSVSDREALQNVLVSSNPALADVDAILAPDGDALLASEFLEGFQLPSCRCCGGSRLKPDVVFFGENVAPPVAAKAATLAAQADAMLVIGSSLMAFSAFRLCKAVAARGKPIFALNHGTTRADDMLTLKLEVSCERVLPVLRALVAG
ncbi:NAD-dependent protein deacetylase [Pseudomonas sp. Marseille-QA0892]